jgi:uncharacterized membrane protein
MQGVLYMGDTTLDTAAAYLAGLMTAWGWGFDYVPSDRSLGAKDLDVPRTLFMLSDYPSSRITLELQQRIVSRVEAGAGLLMIGGWESFHGLGGDWDGTPIGNALPVVVPDGDDRSNCDHPVVVQRLCQHPAVADLPWDERAPVIGGLNRVLPRADATVVLAAQHFQVSVERGTVTFHSGERDALLVVGRHGRGRTAALTTDVAPHWVGPLVDWGPGRVTAQARGAPAIEAGNLYAQFLKQLLSWVGAA